MTTTPPYYPTLPPPADEEHLRLLSVFHYVLAGLTTLFSCFCFPCIYFTIGIALLAWVILVVMALFFMVSLWTLAVLMLLCGRKLARRSGYTFCFVVACLECLFMPFGTVLGVFTIIVLKRPSVKCLFDRPAPSGPPLT